MEDLVSETGEWWTNPWWEKDNYVDLSNYSFDEIKFSIDVLKQHFPAEWALSLQGNEGKNILLRNIYLGESIYQHNFLVGFGREVEILKSSTGFSSILKRLKGVIDCDSAAMELSVAAAFKDRGLKIDFPVPSPSKGKTPDLLVISDIDTVAIECKQLQNSTKSEWRNWFYIELSRTIREHLENDIRTVQLVLNDVCIDRYFNESGEQLRNSHDAAKEVADIICSKVLSEFQETYSPLFFNVPELVFGCFISKDGDQKITSRWPEYDDERVFKRIFANGISRAAAQLSNVDYPGLAFIYHDKVPEYGYAFEEFNRLTKDDELFNNMAAAVIFRPHPLFNYNPPYLLVNKNSKYQYSELFVSKIIETTYQPILPCGGET